MLDEQIIEKTIELKRKYNTKLPDPVIAATCLISDLTLITRNDDDFKKVSELNIYNPFG